MNKFINWYLKKHNKIIMRKEDKEVLEGLLRKKAECSDLSKEYNSLLEKYAETLTAKEMTVELKKAKVKKIPTSKKEVKELYLSKFSKETK